MDAAYDRASPARVGLTASPAPVALNAGARSSPLLSVFDTTGRTRLLLARARLDLRDRLRFSSELHDLRLGMLNLSGIQIAQGTQKAAKVVV